MDMNNQIFKFLLSFQFLLITTALYTQSYKNRVISYDELQINNESLIKNYKLDTIIVLDVSLSTFKSYTIIEREFEHNVSKYPNPWTEQQIAFELGDITETELSITDGDDVLWRIFKYKLSEGIYTIKAEWVFSHLPEGSYFYKLQIGDIIRTNKLEITTHK